jgi:DNA excision repair protein ERCC-2
VQALIAYYEKKFTKRHGRNYAYVYPTMNRVLQAAGRCIRSETDRGVIVLMDKRFTWSSYQATYPPGFEPRGSRDAAADVSAFWAAD